MLEPGRVLSHYKIVEEISRGGMGIVYRATDTRLNRDVARKVLPAELTTDPDRRDVGDEDGVSFIAMELIRGDKHDRLTPRERFYIEGYYHSNKFETIGRAIEAYSKAIELYADHSASRKHLATLYMRLDQYEVPDALKKIGS